MNAIVTFALRQRVLIVVLLVMMLTAGAASFLSLNIEAYPDPVPPLVDIVTQSTGQSAEEIERYITIPLEIQMAGIPNVQAIRTISLFGLSDVDDIVQGTVLMRRGAQSIPTIKRVEAEVDKVNSNGILPPGVSIQRIYDRSDLIHVTTHTVLHNMVAGIVLIFLVQWAFLGNVRSAVIVAMTIPFALSFAIGLMVLRGESANLLSVGAIDFGLVVDATVIMVENIYRHLAEATAHLGRGPSTLHRMRVRAGFRGKTGTISVAAAEVSQSIFFAAAIIIAGFVPLLTLSGIEGHIFGPMAKTYAYAIAGGLIATFTIAPALSLILFRDKVEEGETLIVRQLRRVYEPALEFVLANRIITFAGLALIALLAVFALRSLGLEFLPKLEEGNLWVRATFPQSVSLENSDTYVSQMRVLMSKYPEVQSVVSQHGRPDDGTDATGFFNAEFFVPLKPFDTWPSGTTKEKLTQDMTNSLEQRFPGVNFNFSQYIQDNVEEAASGVKGENSVKVYGNDLETLKKTADAIAAVLAKIPGITDLAVLRSLGQPTIRIDVFAQEAVLAQLEATLPPLHRQLQSSRDLLAVLTGHLPADFKPVRFELNQLSLPTDLPLGVPSQLVERRPDVRAAEAQLHAATAQVGVAIASLLPQVTITGNIGSSATAMGDLFKPGTGFWSLGASLTQTLFEGGTLIHRKRAADAALDQAGALYRSAVLTAFQNVADALHALDTDADALGAAARAENAAQKSLDVVQHQLELGSVSYLALINAEQTYQQASISLTQARANRYADTAALFQALGGSITPMSASPAVAHEK